MGGSGKKNGAVTNLVWLIAALCVVTAMAPSLIRLVDSATVLVAVVGGFVLVWEGLRYFTRR